MVVFYVSLMMIPYDNHIDYMLDVAVVDAIDPISLLILDKVSTIDREDHQ